MGLVGTVIEVLRTMIEGIPITDVKLDEGGDDNTTAELYQPSGSDSNPLPDDLIIAMRVPGKDRFVVVGYLDPVNEPTTEPGEVRLYSRDADGNVVATVRLNIDGFVNLGIDEPENFIPRDDRLQTQLDEIKKNIDDLQSAHDTHKHDYIGDGDNATAQVSGTPDKTTSETYDVGDTATDKVKGE